MWGHSWYSEVARFFGKWWKSRKFHWKSKSCDFYEFFRRLSKMKELRGVGDYNSFEYSFPITVNVSGSIWPNVFWYQMMRGNFGQMNNSVRTVILLMFTINTPILLVLHRANKIILCYNVHLQVQHNNHHFCSQPPKWETHVSILSGLIGGYSLNILSKN